MRKVQSKIPRWQTLVADTRALVIAAWTGALDVRRVAPERRANEFPLEPGAAHALPISVSLSAASAVRAPPSPPSRSPPPPPWRAAPPSSSAPTARRL